MHKQATPEIIVQIESGVATDFTTNTKGIKIYLVDYDWDVPQLVEVPMTAYSTFDFKIYKDKLRKELNGTNNSEQQGASSSGPIQD